MPKNLKDQAGYRELVELLRKQSSSQQERFMERLEELEAEEVQAEVYRIDETAKILGVADNTVRSWLKSGKLQGQKVGKLWLIPKHEVNRVLDR